MLLWLIFLRPLRPFSLLAQHLTVCPIPHVPSEFTRMLHSVCHVLTLLAQLWPQLRLRSSWLPGSVLLTAGMHSAAFIIHPPFWVLEAYPVLHTNTSSNNVWPQLGPLTQGLLWELLGNQKWRLGQPCSWSGSWPLDMQSKCCTERWIALIPHPDRLFSCLVLLNSLHSWPFCVFFYLPSHPFNSSSSLSNQPFPLVKNRVLGSW